MKFSRGGLLLLNLIIGCTAAAQPAPETPAEHNQRMQWWREARFGLFIHWGVYSIPGGTWNGKKIEKLGEWIMHRGRIPVADYAQLPAEFNPVNFDAGAWVQLAKRAGVKYIVITAKHHDGFAMFKTAASPFNIVDATPFNRDPLKELAAACAKQGVRLGFYYSQAQDWHHPGGSAMYGGHWDPAAQDGDMTEYIRKIAVPQVRELLSNYGHVSVLWWDTAIGMDRARADLLAPLLKLQPGIITNNRLGGGYEGDIETPEQRVPATGYPRDWESCMTMNDTWGFKSYDQNWKSATELIRNLVESASKGGNYLLNVGPTPLGEIPAPSIERLEQIGEWLKRNSEGIYATTASPFKALAWGRATQKPGKLYLYVFDWPKNGDLVVPMRSAVKSARFLAGTADALALTPSPEGLHIEVPRVAPDPVATGILLDGVDLVDALPPPPLAASADGALALACDTAALFGPGLRVEGFVEPELANWNSVDAYAQWNVRVDRDGDYEVVVDVCVPPGAAGGQFELSVANQKFVHTTAATGADVYAKTSIGRIRLAKTGATTVALHPLRIAGGELMKLRQLTLRPVAAP